MVSEQLTMEEKLALLRDDYTESLGARIAEIEDAVGAFGEATPGADRLEKIRDIIAFAHKLAGSGATFGFPNITTVSRAMENACKAVLDGGDDNGLAQSLSEMCQALHAAAAEPGDAIEDESLEIKQASQRKTYDPGRKRVIFVSESSDSESEKMRLEMEHFGYDVRIIDHPDKLDAELNKGPVDALVSGIVFGGDTERAIETLTRLQDSKESIAPLMVCTVVDTIHSRLGAVRAGAQAYLVKPVDVADLIDALDTITQRTEAEPFRVLIIDDDVSLARHSELVLQGAGMQTQVATDPMEVLTALDEFSPELILLDLYMPECHGQEIAAVIRQDEEYAGVPIVFLSGEADKDKQLLAMELGGDDFLTKPIRASHLISSVRIRASRFRELRSFMVRDSMTGLFNHTTTKQLLDTEIARAHRATEKLSLASLDIDRFKNVNDTHGHGVGDRVIKSLARLLRQRLRGADVIGRMGGEEFAAILPETGIEEAQGVFDEIRKDFSKIVFHGDEDKEFSVTISIGLAEFPAHATATDLSDAADKALYAAKHAGRNKVVLADIS